ncbi:MAG: chorismate lyase [Gammaproteobacteria bacterium]|nr:chorismate lyase [Gammaproteobacteria bacterium]
MNRFGRHVHEPVWRIRSHMYAQPVPAEMACWLYDSGSLTLRLQRACQTGFRVEVIQQSWQRPMLNEAVRLGISANVMALVRQVCLYCNDLPAVYARTVIPAQTLRGAEQHLAKLGTRPLGAVLFADPNMRRDEIEVACIRSGQRIYNSATSMLSELPELIWARRSVFYLSNKPLLVNEVFLPDIVDCRTNCGRGL